MRSSAHKQIAKDIVELSMNSRNIKNRVVFSVETFQYS